MPFIVANTVYEETSDTDVAIYDVTMSQFRELIRNKDPETGFVGEDQLSFAFDDLAYLDPNVPFTGKIEAVMTFYIP